MSAPRILFWWDTEDFINPESDDALLLILEQFRKRGMPAVFKMVGEKTRALLRRRRTDIIELLKDDRFEIGFHTDLHSIHPTVAEYTERCDWQSGVAEILRRESRGVEVTRETFGKEIICYGQPGASFTPFAYGALRVWGIPAYLGGSVYLGDEIMPTELAGIFSLAGMWSARAGFDARSGREALASAKAALERLRESLPEGALISHGNHPNEWSLDRWWDEVNFLAGASPDAERYEAAPVVTRSELTTRVRLLGDYLDWIRERGFGVVGVRESLSSFSPGKGSLSREDVQAVARQWSTGEVGLHVHAGKRLSLSAAQCLHLLARALARPAAEGFEVARVDAPVYLEGIRTEQRVALTGEKLKALAAFLASYIDRCGTLPARVEAPGCEPVAPAVLGVAIARHLAGGRNTIAVDSVRFLPGELVRTYGKDVGPWSIHRPSFTGENLRRYTQLLSWSYRPLFSQLGR
jgi:hypothetical protein